MAVHADAATVLVRDGRPMSRIVVPRDADPTKRVCVLSLRHSCYNQPLLVRVKDIGVEKTAQSRGSLKAWKRSRRVADSE